MANPSNLYAERVFSEHPIALWALDDQADYISLLNEDSRVLSSASDWTISGGTAENFSNVTNEPFPTSITSKLIGDTPSGASAQITAVSSEIVQSSQLSQDLGNFCIGVYLYSLSQYIQTTEIGYEYVDPQTLETIRVLKLLDTTFPDAWLFLSETFPMPAGDFPIRIVIRITYSGGIDLGGDSFAFLINGLSFGQWSESFNATSLGSERINIPENIPTTIEQGLIARAYGLQESNGYYLIEDNKLAAKNGSVPMVFGSNSVTSITPVDGGLEPSLILPGQGFLNQIGQYKDYTVEMWIKANSYAKTPKRIFGPISSTDGLYVDGPFLTLKIGEFCGSHSIAEWYRPMIVQIKLINNQASLMVNGEIVLALDIISEDLVLPAEYSEEGMHQDWVGFYSYEDVSPIEIDAVAIYPYNVPEVMAKRRFVYGQAVEFPQPSNTAYGGTSLLIDYESARYANNYNYPGLGSWGQGISDNIRTVNRQLSMPEYVLPELVFVNRVGGQWLDDAQESQLEEAENFINLRPTDSWEIENGYILFSSLGMLLDTEKCLFAVFKKPEGEDVEEQILFKVSDSSTPNSLTAILDGNDIVYKFKYNEVETVIHTQESYILDEEDVFTVGLDFEKLSQNFGNNMRYFLSDKNRLRLYVGGDETFLKTYTGNIYRVGVSNSKNFIKKYGEDDRSLKSAFDNLGFFQYSDSEYFSSFVASYTLVPQKYLGRFILDIAVDSYWEDYVPLQKMARYVKDANGQPYYGLDFLQINVDYPEPRIVGNSYDNSNNLLKMYVTFQPVKSGASSLESNFTNVEAVPINGVVSPGSNWLRTKYEVINGTVIYPPAGASIESLSINVHFEFNVTKIISTPLKVKALEIASQAISSLGSTEIGTKYGEKILPYTKSGVYFNYKNKNPYRIYKGKNPYFYLNRTSGIRLVGDYSANSERGLSTRINPGRGSEYEVIALQMAINYDNKEIPNTPQHIFEIQGKNSYTKFFIEKVGSRGRLYAVNALTNSIDNSIVFYINGKLVSKPFIEMNEWNILGISFSSPINLNSYTGAFRVTGPVMLNNISHYKLINFQSVTQIRTRPWADVKVFGETSLAWQFWFPAYSWAEVLVIASSTTYVVNPGATYQIYTGTNKIIVDDDRATSIKNYQYSIYTGVTWNTLTLPAV